ncbi:MAG: class I SAM-dependent methyltransferase [Anaerolineales bacterium]
MPTPRYFEIEYPDLVLKANKLAEELGFPLLQHGTSTEHHGPSACIPQVGKLLQTLVAGKPNGLIGEIGTGAGVGTAWLASGLIGNAKLISVEIDAVYSEAARKLFSEHPQVEIRTGDWHDVLKIEEPFDLLFFDVAPHTDLEFANWDTMIQYLKIGGQIVLDDLTPIEQWPVEWETFVDAKREFALHNAHVIGTEIRTTPTTSAVILTRIK